MLPSTLPHQGRPATPSLWLRTLHQWHWISSALSLLGMALFAVTGITLNHASQIESRPVVHTRKGTVPSEVLQEVKAVLGQARTQGAQAERPLPPGLRDWLQAQWALDVGERAAEWSSDEVYLPMPRPGGDAWLRLDLSTGGVEYELTDRGWISWLNDLHKGRHTGEAWRWFIDLFAFACLVFTITGLLILKVHALKRPLTWPMVGLGCLIPTLLALLFIH